MFLPAACASFLLLCAIRREISPAQSFGIGPRFLWHINPTISSIPKCYCNFLTAIGHDGNDETSSAHLGP
ncbi:MAG: hypothetical protein JO182_29610 [Acidobacteriaceae bacterium]|nr:hypothetical protein [Acidobacteriaceae bacterium]